MKKVLAAALLCAVSSFATWDMFPIQDAGKGEAKVAFGYAMPEDKLSAMGLNLGARYSIISGLEAAILLDGSAGEYGNGGYVISCDYDGNTCPGHAGEKEYTGLNNPIVAVRYWLPMGLGIAVDAILPFGSKAIVGDKPQFGLNAGVQYSQKFSDQLSLGSEALLNIINKEEHGGETYDMGMKLNLAVEVDYSFGATTPWVAIDLQPELSKGDKNESDDMTLGLSVGATYDINQSMYAQASFWIGLSGYKDGNDESISPKTIAATYGIKF